MGFPAEKVSRGKLEDLVETCKEGLPESQDK